MGIKKMDEAELQLDCLLRGNQEGVGGVLERKSWWFPVTGFEKENKGVGMPRRDIEEDFSERDFTWSVKHNPSKKM